MSDQQVLILPVQTVSITELEALRRLKALVENYKTSHEMLVTGWQSVQVRQQLSPEAMMSYNASLAILAVLDAILRPAQPDETQEIEVVNDV